MKPFTKKKKKKKGNRKRSNKNYLIRLKVSI